MNIEERNAYFKEQKLVAYTHFGIKADKRLKPVLFKSSRHSTGGEFIDLDSSKSKYEYTFQSKYYLDKLWWLPIFLSLMTDLCLAN